jgi:hypothetical protein
MSDPGRVRPSSAICSVVPYCFVGSQSATWSYDGQGLLKGGWSSGTPNAFASGPSISGFSPVLSRIAKETRRYFASSKCGARTSARAE